MKLLVVVDMQNDFIDGVLGSPEAQAIVPAVAAKIKQYRENGDAIIYTADTHYAENYARTMEGQKLPVLHCVQGTHGWDIADGLYVPGAPVVTKVTFGSDELPRRIISLINYLGEELEAVEFVGLCTDICVISNVMITKAFLVDTPIIVDSKCCAGVTPASHENALNAMKMCHIDII